MANNVFSNIASVRTNPLKHTHLIRIGYFSLKYGDIYTNFQDGDWPPGTLKLYSLKKF